MGLLDVLNGMANGPGGQPDPRDASSGGMSKLTMALLAFLGYKAYRNWTSQDQPTGDRSERRDDPRDRGRDDRYAADDDRDEYHRAPSGGLGEILKDMLGGGQRRSETIRRGIGHSVEDFDRDGQGDIARSWVGRGENREISEAQLEASIGERGMRDLMQHTGMDRKELLEALRHNLPRAIDRLTPEGRIPTREEASRDWRD